MRPSIIPLQDMGNDANKVNTSTSERISRQIRPITGSDLKALAEVHIGSGTPGFLSDLGISFLENIYYAVLIDDPYSGGAAIDIGNEVAGFVTYSTDSSKLFRSIFLKKPIPFIMSIIKSMLKRPRILLDFLGVVFHVQADRLATGVDAEVVSLEVRPPYQGLGLGYFLIERAVSELRTKKQGQPIKVRIFSDHVAVARLYESLNFHEVGKFRLNGRNWSMMVNDEPRPSN